MHQWETFEGRSLGTGDEMSRVSQSQVRALGHNLARAVPLHLTVNWLWVQDMGLRQGSYG